MVILLDIVGRSVLENLPRYNEKCSKAMQIYRGLKDSLKNNPFRFSLKNDSNCNCLSQATGSSKA